MFMKLFLVEDATIYMILLQIYYTKEGVKMKNKQILTGILAAAMLLATGSISTVYGADVKTLADYPQYNEIVRKYYEGALAGWDISQFQENDLCYLAGYYSDINK